MEEGRREKVSIPYRLVVGAGLKGEAIIYTAPAGAILHIKKVRVHFPAGVAGELHIALRYGNLKVWPATDYANGDDVTIEDEVDLRYFSGDPIRLWYENISTTEPRSVDIKLEGVLE